MSYYSQPGRLSRCLDKARPWADSMRIGKCAHGRKLSRQLDLTILPFCGIM